ncbi:virion structural protein [Lactococcus phage PLgW-1]|uniref:Uncharacterized protein n=3 Tax=Uwajimavirus PLgW1 TaxID=2845441 RepID=A0A2Z2P6N1_9CAUD|nr:virion structural protein [Lactococcus phage PLgW-1]ARQ94822.1 hypothetical protein PLgW1_11 [Lactococcus phage PLgW-1]ASJ79995.1 hypothetical protein [Lactococcus phage PLgY-16]ASJ80050.1 hypothetical protein [Lactococcus phage PLgY-30]
MPLSKELDVKSVSSFFEKEVTMKVSDFVQRDVQKRAVRAGRRPKRVWNRHSGKTYRYTNTGQLGRNIKKIRSGEGYKIDAGTRGNYTHGYHGLYFLVERQGERDVRSTLNATKKYAEALKV